MVDWNVCISLYIIYWCARLIYRFMCVYAYTHIDAYNYINSVLWPTYIYICKYIHMYIYIYMCVCKYIYMYIYIYVHVHLLALTVFKESNLFLWSCTSTPRLHTLLENIWKSTRTWESIINVYIIYPLVMTNIAIEHGTFIVDLPIENGDVP